MAQNFAVKEIKPNIGKGRVTGTGRDKLTSSRDLVEETYYLFVRVVKVKELPWNAARGICDPFVEIKVGNYKGRTSYLENKPDWNQVFAFRKERIQTSTMDIIVRERGLPTDEIIGKVCFNISDFPTRVPPDSPLAPQWYKLDDKNGIWLGMGELMLATWFGTQADEVFPNAWNSDLTIVSGDSVVNTQSKVYVSPKLWYLRVSIVEAQDLASKSKTPEVYVKANLGFVNLKTRVSSNKTLNPKWNEDLMFVAAEPFDDPLVLTVVEKLGDNKEGTLGKCEIPVSKVFKRNIPESVGAKWYDLKQVVAEELGEAKDPKFATKLSMKVSLDGGYHVYDEPVHISSDFRPTFKALWPGTIGVLELGILGATGLIPMKSRNGRETTDAYCVAKYGPKWIRTRTAVDTFAPKWNEQYVWDIYEPYSVLTIGIFDNCHLHGEGMLVGPKDPKIGKLRIRLSTLTTNRIYTYSYPILAMQPTGIKKMGELQLAIRFTCPSYLALYQSYTRLLVPKMQIILPLSVYQLDSLRQQAVEILSMRLTRTEPPLRKEVVECMLDADAQMWSMRRAKANFERLKAVYGVFFKAWKVFDDLRQWRDVNKSSTVLFAGIILLILPTCYFLLMGLAILPLYCFGIICYRLKTVPKEPPFMNVKLSLAESVNADDLDEEFDSFPSSKQGDVLRMRYDRLRSFAAKIMHMIGDLACHGERISSLWSAEDPRATWFFLFACYGAALYLLAIAQISYPWNWKFMAISVWWYTMAKRFPWLRRDGPTVPSIFLRKLPTKVDRLL